MQLTTQLDAINTMLSVIGEMPISSLDSATSAEAAVARTILNEVIRDVQAEGLWFNRETNYTLARAADHTITAPANTIRAVFDPLCRVYQYITPKLRGLRVYDAWNHTYTFNADIKCSEIVFMLDWDELPETVRKYIYTRAARRLQARFLTSGTIETITEMEETLARRDMLADDCESSQPNLLNNPDINWIRQRS